MKRLLVLRPGQPVLIGEAIYIVRSEPELLRIRDRDAYEVRIFVEPLRHVHREDDE